MKKKKPLKKLGIEGTSSNSQRAFIKKPTANIRLNDDRMNAFSVRLGTKKRCPFSSLFNIVLGVLESAIGQEKINNTYSNNWNQNNLNKIGKKEEKTSLSLDGMTLCRTSQELLKTKQKKSLLRLMLQGIRSIKINCISIA